MTSTPLDKLIVWLDEEIVWRRRMARDLGGGAVLLKQDEILAERLALQPPPQPGADGRLVLEEAPEAKRSPEGRAEDVPETVRVSVQKLRREIAWLSLQRSLALAVQAENWDKIDWFKTSIERPPGRTFEERREALR